MAKKNVTISMDGDVWESAKNRGINISGICEDTLRQVVETFERGTLPENCTHNFTYPFSVPWGLAKQCKRCGIIKEVVIKTEEAKERQARERFKKEGLIE